MPHGLFLGSHFSTVNRLEEVDEKARDSIDSLDSLDEAQEQESRAAAALPQSTAPKSLLVRAHAFLIRVIPSIDVDAIRPSSVDPRPSDPPSYGFTGARVPEIAIDKPPKVDIKTVRTHLPHASWDIALSLLFFAITINSAILIVASAAFYYGESGTTAVVADLFSAFELLKTTVGKGSAILFAIALLAAGQSASLTVTLAGQVISEGMINWRTSPFLRRIVTRGIAIIPSFAVAAAVGRDGLDTMLVASQVALSMALPFVVFPLLFVTGLKSSMAVWEPTPENGQPLPVPTSVSVRSSALANQLPSSNSESGTTPEQRPTYPRMETDSSIKSPWSESEAASTLLSPPPQCATLGMAYEQGRSSNAGPASLPLSAIRPNATSSSSSNHPLPATANAGVGAGGLGEAGERTESNLGGKFHYFSNRWYISILAWIVFGVIVIADGFVLVTLFLGDL